MSLLNIGVTGLNAAQAGLVTTGHNIANASVDGFTRQSAVQTTQDPMYTGGGFFGQGTRVDTVKRIYSDYLTQQVLAADTRRAQFDTYADQLSQIDNMLADTSAGLSPAVQDFFQAVQDMAANPASIPARQSMISTADSLVSRFHFLDQRINEIRSGVEDQIESTIGEISSFAQQIADTNQRILVAQAGGSGQPPNDLLDQRDRLIGQLNQLTRVSTLKESDGSLSIFMGSGQPLVVGTHASTLQATPDPSDPQRLGVSLLAPGGATVAIPESLLDGGRLGGLLAFRAESLDSAQDQLGEIALAFADSFNTQHALGLDLNGNPGGDVFTFTSGTSVTARTAAADLRVSTAVAGDPRLIAAASPAVVDTALSNSGTGKLSGLTFNSSTGLPLSGDITLTFDATTNNLIVSGAVTATLPYDPATQANGASFSFASPDLSFSFSGVPANGDTFTLTRTTAGVSDNRNGVLLGALQLKKTMFGQTASYQSAYSRLVTQMGNKTREVQVNRDAQASLLKEATSARDSVSAVNLDEEAANLIRYQQAYQAAAKVMTIASTLFDEVLAIGR